MTVSPAPLRNSGRAARAEFEQDLASRIAPLLTPSGTPHNRACSAGTQAAGLGHDDDLSTLLTSSWTEAQILQKENRPSL